MKQLLLIITIACIFMLGWFSSLAVSNSNLQIPFAFNTSEKPSPKDRVSEDDIVVLKDKIIINIPDATFAGYTDTNSMDPLIDIESNGLEIVPKSQNDLQVGDVIAYQSGYGVIIHRIIQIDQDKQGWYCITKGDNSTIQDSNKIRFEQVKFVLIGVIY